MSHRHAQAPEVHAITGFRPASDRGVYVDMQHPGGSRISVVVPTVVVAMGWDRLRQAVQNVTDRAVTFSTPCLRSPMDLLPTPLNPNPKPPGLPS